MSRAIYRQLSSLRMGTKVLLALSAIALAGCIDFSRSAAQDPLITGRAIAPPSEPEQDVGSMPMNLGLSPDGRYAISSDMGLHEWLWSIRTSDGKGVSNVEFSNSAPAAPAGENSAESSGGADRSNGLYYGLAISPDGSVYAAQGAHDSIAVLKLSEDGSLSLQRSIKTRAHDFPAGLALDGHSRLYVANNTSGDGDPFKLTASVAIYDTSGGSELGRVAFTGSYGGTSNFPLGIAALRDGSKAYVASERDDAVYALDTRDPAAPRIAATIATGAHPVAVLLSPDQRRLFVANSLGDTVSVVDTAKDKVIGTALLRPAAARDLPGVTPTGLALSPDQKTLYASCADLNAVAVIDAASMEVRGYIGAGWYPSSVIALADGKHLMVTNAKGSKPRNPTNRPDPHEPRRKTTPMLGVLEGNVSAIRIPTGDELKEASDEVMSNGRLDAPADSRPNPLASIGRASGKITHVIYIIKENRTYDQILGDLPRGNGDPSLVLFGRDVTPNQHALAERFVLLDNLYACGEVSGDGWAWSTQGMADAYVARNVPYHYSHRGRKFDFEGHNNGYPSAGFPTAGEDGKPLATNPTFKNGLKPIPDVGSTGFNIWDAARSAGVSLRNYGFFLYFADHTSGTPGGPDNYPVSQGLLPAGHDLAGITDLDYRRFDMDYPDSDAPSTYEKQTGDAHCLFKSATYGDKAAPSRFAEWKREFQMMLAKDASGGAVPALMLVRLPMDHTSGASGGKHTPRSYVADNDYAVGQFVEAVSNSPIWEHTAILVIEDDAQNGVDHVDAHRMPGYVISPWIKAHAVDHHFHNTDSVLRTIELLLGLRPLCQYDAIADPIMDWDASPTNIEPFHAILPPKELVCELNPRRESLRFGDPRRELAKRSEEMDFTHADAAPAGELSEIVWKTVKGPQSRMPPPRGVSGDDDD